MVIKLNFYTELGAHAYVSAGSVTGNVQTIPLSLCRREAFTGLPLFTPQKASVRQKTGDKEEKNKTPGRPGYRGITADNPPGFSFAGATIIPVFTILGHFIFENLPRRENETSVILPVETPIISGGLRD